MYADNCPGSSMSDLSMVDNIPAWRSYPDIGTAAISDSLRDYLSTAANAEVAEWSGS